MPTPGGANGLANRAVDLYSSSSLAEARKGRTPTVLAQLFSRQRPSPTIGWSFQIKIAPSFDSLEAKISTS